MFWNSPGFLQRRLPIIKKLLLYQPRPLVVDECASVNVNHHAQHFTSTPTLFAIAPPPLHHHPAVPLVPLLALCPSHSAIIHGTLRTFPFKQSFSPVRTSPALRCEGRGAHIANSKHQSVPFCAPH